MSGGVIDEAGIIAPRASAVLYCIYIKTLVRLFAGESHQHVHPAIYLGEIMAEVELRQIGAYAVTELLRRSSTSDFYRGKQRKKDILLQRLNIAIPTSEGKELFLTRARQL